MLNGKNKAGNFSVARYRALKYARSAEKNRLEMTNNMLKNNLSQNHRLTFGIDSCVNHFE